MGLDMYAFRAKKPSKEDIEAVKASNEYITDNLDILPMAEKEKFADLIPFGEVVDVPREYIDIEKIMKDGNISDKYHLGGTAYSKEGIELSFFADNEVTKVVRLDSEEKIKKYTIVSIESSLVVVLEEVGYWRKDYKLAEAVAGAYEGVVDNCDYVKCNDEMKELLVGAHAHFEQEEDNIFYHEWY